MKEAIKKIKKWEKSCWWLDGYDGISCNGYRSKKTALIAIIELWNDDKEYNTREHGDFEFSEDNIKVEDAVFCPKCSYFTIGENFCAECDRKYHTIKTYSIYFEDLSN